MEKEDAKRDEIIGMEKREGKITRLFYESGRIERQSENTDISNVTERVIGGTTDE